MKTFKILTGLLVVLGFTFNNVHAQNSKFVSEVWDNYYIDFTNVECIGEQLVGVLYSETLTPSPTHWLHKSYGTFFGEISNEQYEVQTVAPGRFVWNDKTGLNFKFTETWHILKNGKLFAVVSANLIFRINPGDKWIVVDHYVANCK